MEEQKYKEFFSWLFNNEVTLNSQKDISTLENIYYSNEIKNIIDSPEMQRLKKIMQLSTIIIDNTTAYHTRYDHSLGTYNNGVKIYLKQFEDSAWRNEHSSEDEKLEITASLLELLTHDIGHLTFSHTLESLIGEHGTHEVITDRIVAESLEKYLKDINPRLYEVMMKRKNHNVSTLKEGNIDLDRMDYLLHDYLYLNDDNYELETTIENILEHTKMENIAGDKMVPVFDNDVVPELKKFLSLRKEQYRKYYNSNARATSDNMCRVFGELILSTEDKSAEEFKKYLKECVESKTNLDLCTHKNWNDVNTLNSFINIIENSDNEDLVKVALVCMPTLDGLINLVYKMVDFPEEVDKNDANLEELIPDEEERKLYSTVKKYVKGKALTPREQMIREELLLKAQSKKDTTIYEFSEEGLENTREKLKKLELPQGLIDKITWEKKIRMYSPININYARQKDGSIENLMEHPDFDLDMTPTYIRGGFIHKSVLKQYGLSEGKVKQIQDVFETEGIKQEKSQRKISGTSRISENEDIEYKNQENNSQER